MKAQEIIKKILDEQCLCDFWYKCSKYRVPGKDSITGRPHKEEVQCWMCHRNDVLAKRIAEVGG